ncbi:M1 family aminopeptidase [Sphingomonas sp. Leaf33]|uniref:M1 family aminopeptidase n=1 Tax=Sphingomonas sp. Leaf33 TaxID=1736215 RepID=UPI0009E758E9|nr:M1 family aminopeptidase [Sphingomonas sp. Leaf33]
MTRLLPLALAPLLLAAAPPPGQGFDVERYQVTLRPDVATAAVSARERIILRATTSGVATLDFSPNALAIADATIAGRPITVTRTAQATRFTLPRPLRRSERVTLSFALSGTPARGLTATAGHLYAGYFACDWMVCRQDSPGDKAWFDLDLDLPAGVQSLGTGRRVAMRGTGGGLVRHRWRATRPYSPYLFAFAAGALPQRGRDTRHGRIMIADATGTARDVTAELAETQAMVAFLAERAGVALPDRRYAQLLVPGREAQETASFSLIGVDELARDRDDPAGAWVMAHELAHQWWGNLVTCATWRDFWLNEGITTFMVAAWQQQRFGEAAYRRSLDIARARVDQARVAGFDRPLAWDGRYPSLRLRRAIQYSKGALFVAELRDTMGDAAFWAGLRRYTRANAGGTVTSLDFQHAMQRSTPHDLTPLFRERVYGNENDAAAITPGRPRPPRPSPLPPLP